MSGLATVTSLLSGPVGLALGAVATALWQKYREGPQERVDLVQAAVMQLSQLHDQAVSNLTEAHSATVASFKEERALLSAELSEAREEIVVLSAHMHALEAEIAKLRSELQQGSNVTPIRHSRPTRKVV